MSDLAATNCGCGNECGNNSCGCGNNLLFLLLILCACGNGFGGNSCDDGCGCGFGNFGNFGGDGCGCLIWIILLSCLCGHNC